MQEQAGCVIKVPLDEDEPVQITGMTEGVEKAKCLILDILRESLTRIDGDRDFALARSQYFAAKRTLCNLTRGEANNTADNTGGETTNSDGETSGEEKELARAAAQNQLFSAHLRLQVIAYGALQTDDVQGGEVL